LVPAASGVAPTCAESARRSAQDDDQVMAGVKAGSTVALGVLYDRYCARAYRIARSVCRDEDRAQEAVQETFISIWRTRETYRDDSRVTPWVLTVARHRSIDVARRNGLHAAHRAGAELLHDLPTANGVVEQVMARARVGDLRSLLAELPDAQREVIALAFYGELTHSEIAAQLGLPLGTVKGRMRLGLRRLRAGVADV
jgi:RNA polymerase sigma-70 factor (ECF subfamily)